MDLSKLIEPCNDNEFRICVYKDYELLNSAVLSTQKVADSWADDFIYKYKLWN